MAEERDFINWAKLVEYPVYNASMMKPNPEYESSIIGICNGTVLTPDSAYEDTVKDKEAFTVRVFSRRYTESGKDASVSVRMGKEDFTRIMCECVKTRPKKYVWEHPEFDKMFNSCIVGLCATMNRSNLGDLFVRARKDYVFSKGTGLIHNNDIVSGAFTGFVLKARYTDSDNVMINLVIPKLVHNTSNGNLASSTLTYVDKEANVCITIAGSGLSGQPDGSYTVESKRSTPTVAIAKVDSKSHTFIVSEDSYSDLTSKRLKIPMNKFDFRLAGVLSGLEVPVTVSSHVPLEHTLGRLAKMRR